MTDIHEIQTPIPGIFYRRPSPGEPLFVEVGSSVEVGDTVGTVEIMKSFHPIMSTVSGVVVSVADDQAEVTPGESVAQVQAVEAGQ